MNHWPHYLYRQTSVDTANKTNNKRHQNETNLGFALVRLHLFTDDKPEVRLAAVIYKMKHLADKNFITINMYSHLAHITL